MDVRVDTLAADSGRITVENGSNAKSAAGSMPKATRSGRTCLIACDGHSLHFGLSAPPTAAQASVLGVAIETQLCSNDANVTRRTAAPTYST
jgi:hypothetical protein